MAPKSKLEYQSQEPAFLRRMRAQNSGIDADGRHERQIARPSKPRLENEDDAPTYIDEGGDTMSKAEYEALMAKERKDGEIEKGDGNGEAETLGVTGKGEDVDFKASGALPDEGVKKTENTNGVTLGSKKRKAAKVIGDGEDAAEQEVAPKKSTRKSGKKGKPIKLSFDEE